MTYLADGELRDVMDMVNARNVESTTPDPEPDPQAEPEPTVPAPIAVGTPRPAPTGSASAELKPAPTGGGRPADPGDGGFTSYVVQDVFERIHGVH